MVSMATRGGDPQQPLGVGGVDTLRPAVWTKDESLQQQVQSNLIPGMSVLLYFVSEWLCKYCG